MAIEAESGYRYLGGGTGLALEVTGPTMESCLARAVEGLADACGDVHPSVVGRRVEIVVDEAEPASMLRQVLARVASLRENGELPVRVEDTTSVGGRVVVAVEVVRAPGIRLVMVVPPPTDWQHLALEQRDGHWVGRLVAS